jgi:pimeloyl-ACP methyl ester carboxylesterase
MRDHLVDVLDALELEQCGLVGHSMGAAISAAAALSSPERILRLVMIAPVGFAGVRGMKFFRLITPRFIEPLLPRLASRALVRTMLNIVYGSLRRPTQRDVDEFHAPVRLPGYTRAMRNLLHRFNWHAPFPQLSIPLLTIVGSEDVLSPSAEASRYGNNSVTVDGAGHVLFDEAPERINSLLAEFFA